MLSALASLLLAGGFTPGAGGSASPLTTKGDLYTYSTTNTRLPTSTDGLCLKTLNAAATGLEWGSCAAGAADAPADGTYVTNVPNATLTNEQALSLLSTGLMLSTTGTGVVSIKATNTCTNQFPRSDTASGVWTCASVADADLASSYSGVGACGANTVATTLNDNAAPTCTALTSSYLPTVPVTKGGTNLTTIAANQVWVGTAADTVTVKTIPSCSNATTRRRADDSDGAPDGRPNHFVHHCDRGAHAPGVARGRWHVPG
jgi:hypothetical protein